MNKPRLFVSAVLAAMGLMSGLAAAQPNVSYDMGMLAAPGNYVQSAGVGSASGTWIKFQTPEISRCQRWSLDIVVEALGGFDTEIGLYDSGGKRITNDDDDGVGVASELTFGAISPVRSYGGDSRPGDGRDGPLPAGT